MSMKYRTGLQQGTRLRALQQSLRPYFPYGIYRNEKEVLGAMGTAYFFYNLPPSGLSRRFSTED